MQKHQASMAEPLPVSGTGVLLDSSNFYLVPSQSEDGRSHVVTQLPTRLSCDCKSYFYRQRCAHIAAVTAHKQRLQLAVAEQAETPETPETPEETETETETETPEERYGLTTAGREALAVWRQANSPERKSPRASLLNRTRAFSLLA